MRKEDMNLFSLLEFHPGVGKIFCEDERMMLFTASSVGALQKLLLDRFGIDETRKILSRFGYSHGFHCCLTAEQLFGKKHTGEIAVRFHEIVGSGKYVNTTATEPPGFKYLTDYVGSAEVEQYLANFGKSDIPVCWWAAGFASGYCTAHFETETYHKERRCAAQGCSHCEVEAREGSQWGDELAGLREIYGFTSSEDVERYRQQQCALHQQWHLDRKQRLQMARQTSNDEWLSVRESLVQITEAHNFIVREEPMWEALEHAVAVAKLDTPVLIHGETGTGKEFVANLIHNQSARAIHPLVSINCAALTESLLESELFGHVKGAFTGAVSDKPGLFEIASNSTLFLDEIGDMPVSVQAKLLRVLENGELRRVGSTQTIQVHPRILAATHHDLQTLVAKNEFRADLYFRLNSLTIELQPLRLRRDSIPAMAQSFLTNIARKFNKQIESISPEAMSALVRYRWPGNVRELKHAIERAVVVAHGSMLALTDLPPEVVSPAPTEEAPQTGGHRQHISLKEGERSVIVEALAAHSGNRTATARALNIDISTLWRKMRRYGLL